MKYFILTILSFCFIGCSGEQMSQNITKTQIAMSGNKPPAFFKIANIQTMRDYVFDTKDFSFSLPSAKQRDFDVMGGWEGASSNNGRHIGVYMSSGVSYHLNVSTRTSKYTERERAFENGTRKYQTQRKTHNGKVININVHTEYHGKEKYKCIVSQSYDKKQGKFSKGYSCYKFNPQRTMYKRVNIGVTYHNSPTLPEKYQSIAKEYTYKDLQKRAKRTLNSLYIKDGWSK